MADFAEIKITSLQEFLVRTQDFSEKPGWIFRGEEELPGPVLQLQSALERYCVDNQFDLGDVGYHEYLLTREFRRRAHHYLTDLPDDTDYLEWWSLMRHYGAPPRLLDWAYSIYVATYFALEKKPEPNNSHIVWAIDLDWAAKASRELLRKVSKNRGHQVQLFLEGPMELNHSKCFFDVFLKEPFVACAYPLTPFRLNERLTIQKGLFLIPGDITKPFKANLMKFSNYQNKNKFVKIMISSELRKDILGHLLQMNISRATLFPDLDGFAKSLGVYNYYMTDRLRDKYVDKWKWPEPNSRM